MIVNREYTRDVPGWSGAPVPICHGGDYRALTFCCHPDYPLTFSNICLRRKALREIGLSESRYVEIKEWFSGIVNWRSNLVCFGSLSYCCMRRRGCPGGRDYVLMTLYGSSFEKALEEYFLRKRVLAVHLLREASNRDLVKGLIELEVSGIKQLGRSDLIELLNLRPP
ncbi:MAG: methanogenesis marker 9 domain-containing protein [Candidatus Nezhaarchaeales archaeon]